MMFAEFRVYVQVDETQAQTLSRMRDFIRACIGNLDGVTGVEVEAPRGTVLETFYPQTVRTAKTTH